MKEYWKNREVSPSRAINRRRNKQSKRDNKRELVLRERWLDAYNTQKFSINRMLFSSMLHSLSICAEEDVTKCGLKFDYKIDGTYVKIVDTIRNNCQYNIDELIGTNMYENVVRVDKLEEIGSRCIHIYDWDDPKRIALKFQNKEKLVPSVVTVDKLTKVEIETFRLMNSLHDPLKRVKQSAAYGLYYDDRLVASVSVLKRQDRSELSITEHLQDNEIDEVSIRPIIDHIFKCYPQVQKLYAYVDRAKEDGHEYVDAGFSIQKDFYPERVWSKGIEMITQNSYSVQSISATLGYSPNSKYCKYIQMLEEGWLPVYDCGVRTLTYNKEE